MKYSIAFLSALLWWSACTQAPQAPQAQTSEAQAAPAAASDAALTIDPQRSQVIAIGTKVTGRHEIAFPIKEGRLVPTPEGCVSGGRVVLDLARLEVRDLQGDLKAKLEGHLKSPDFFDVEKYPEAIFEITGCERVKDDSVYVSGNLTMRGVTKNIRFPARLFIEGGTLLANASFNINRQEWGIAFKGKPDDLIRDEVNISFSIQANASSAPSP